MNKKFVNFFIVITALLFCGLPGFVIGVLSVGKLVKIMNPGMTPTLISLAPLFLAASLMLMPGCIGLFLFWGKISDQ